MFNETAITPQLFDKVFLSEKVNKNSLRDVLRDIIRSSTIVVLLNKKEWEKSVEQYIKRLPHEAQNTFQTLLKTLTDRHRLVGHDDDIDMIPKNEDQWIASAKFFHKKSQLDKIICTKELPPLIETPESLRDGEAWENMTSHQTEKVIQTEKIMEERLGRLLHYAKKVTIIDPYFNPHFSHYAKSLRIILDTLSYQRGMRKKNAIINIHLKYNEKFMNKNKKDWQRKKDEVLEDFGHKLTVYFWDDSSTPLRIHDRFIITDQYGVSVGDGLNIHDDDIQKKSTWALLDNQATIDTLDEYSENSSEYTLKHII